MIREARGYGRAAACLAVVLVIAGCVRGDPSQACLRITRDQLHVFFKQFETASAVVKAEEVGGEGARDLAVLRVLDVGTDMPGLAEGPAGSFVFLPGKHTCYEASFQVLLQTQGRLDPCLARIDFVKKTMGMFNYSCPDDARYADHGDFVTCWAVETCDMNLAEARRSTLLMDFPRARDPDAESTEGEDGEESEEVAEESSEESSEEDADSAKPEDGEMPADATADAAESESEPEGPRVLVDVLDASAQSQIDTLKYIGKMPVTTFFHSLYPIVTLDYSRDRMVSIVDLVEWLEQHAYDKVVKARDLQFGDVLLLLHMDDRDLSQREILTDEMRQKLIDDGVGEDSLGVYLGRGYVVRQREPGESGICSITVENVAHGYTRAYRVIPGYALSEYRVSPERISQLMADCYPSEFGACCRE